MQLPLIGDFNIFSFSPIKTGKPWGLTIRRLSMLFIFNLRKPYSNRLNRHFNLLLFGVAWLWFIFVPSIVIINEMNAEDLGFNTRLEKFRTDNKLDGFETGRVIAEHKERYKVRTSEGEYEAEILGNLRFTARNREDFPAVGDWVALTTYDADFAIIHKIFPRYSVIKRQAVGQSGEIQIIATNIDYAFLVQALTGISTSTGSNAI